MEAGPLIKHLQGYQSIARGDQVQLRPPPPTTPGEAQTYQVSFPEVLTRLRCPVTGCQGGGMTNRTNLRFHFSYRHIQDSIVILEEGKWTYPH